MDNSMPILLIPGLVSSPRIYAPVLPALWRHGPVTPRLVVSATLTA